MSCLTSPKLVKAGWESTLVWLLLAELELGDEVFTIEYLNAVSRVPEDFLDRGVKGLIPSREITKAKGGFRLSGDLSSHARGGAGTDDRAHGGASGAGASASAGRIKTRRSFRARMTGPGARIGAEMSGLEAYLVETWGDLAERGKPLSEWVDLQKAAHPDMDLVAEAKKARAWEMGQKRQKTAVRRFLGNWFNRAEGFEKEVVIRATGGASHWSGLGPKEKERAISEGHWEHTWLFNGVSVIRDLRDDMFVLSGQDMVNANLPYKDLLSAVIKDKLEGNGDPYEPGPLGERLKEKGARAESSRALQWAIDQIVTDVRYELGLLPV